MSELTREEARQFIHIRDKYEPLQKIGAGTFSTVYKAIDIKHSKNEMRYVALKNITRTSAPNRVAEELKFLKIFNGSQNILGLISCKRFEDQIILVTPYFEYIDFRDLLADIDMIDIKSYMYNLLVALKNVHEKNVIHRDIKPSNFLYSVKERKGLLIDFGLAQFEKIREEKLEKKKNSVLFFSHSLIRATKPPGYYIGDGRPQMRAARAGTRGFRAPEVLLRVPNQTTKIDIWSGGVILLMLLTKQYPFFHSMDDLDAIVEIGTIFGHKEMKRMAKYYGRVWKSNIQSIPQERVYFEEILTKIGQPVDPLSISLLEMMMDLYSEKRISAAAALEHPFFDEIKPR